MRIRTVAGDVLRAPRIVGAEHGGPKRVPHMVSDASGLLHQAAQGAFGVRARGAEQQGVALTGVST